MKYSSLDENLKKSYIKGRKRFFVMLSVIVILLVVSTLNIIYSDGMAARYTLASSIVLVYPMLMLSNTFLTRQNTIKLISLDQFHEYDENGITVYDKINDVKIENTFLWTDIIHIEEKNFTSFTDFFAGKRSTGLVIVTDKESFYKGINKKIKTIDKIEKKEIKLSGGCFIQCDYDDIIQIEKYWGKKIQE